MYFPCALWVHTSLILSLLTCQSFSTRTVTAQCINSCEFTLTTISNFLFQIHFWQLTHSCICTYVICTWPSHTSSFYLIQSLAEEQSKRVKELSEELASVQEELDQQKRLNETLVRRKVHELHLFVCGRCRRMTYLYVLHVCDCVCLYIRICTVTWFSIICEAVHVSTPHHSPQHFHYHCPVLVASVWGCTEEEGFAQL